jgi:hypothetical protein
MESVQGLVASFRARMQGASAALSFLPGRGSVGHIADSTHLRLASVLIRSASVRRSFPSGIAHCAGVGVTLVISSRFDTRAASHEVISLSAVLSPVVSPGHRPGVAVPVASPVRPPFFGLSRRGSHSGCRVPCQAPCQLPSRAGRKTAGKTGSEAGRKPAGGVDRNTHREARGYPPGRGKCGS